MSDDYENEDPMDKLIRGMKEASKESRQGFWCEVPATKMKALIEDKIHELENDIDEIKEKVKNYSTTINPIMKFLQELPQDDFYAMLSSLSQEKRDGFAKAFRDSESYKFIPQVVEQSKIAIKDIYRKIDRLKVYASSVVEKEKYKMSPHDFDSIFGSSQMIGYTNPIY